MSAVRIEVVYAENIREVAQRARAARQKEDNISVAVRKVVASLSAEEKDALVWAKVQQMVVGESAYQRQQVYRHVKRPAAAPLSLSEREKIMEEGKKEAAYFELTTLCFEGGVSVWDATTEQLSGWVESFRRRASDLLRRSDWIAVALELCQNEQVERVKDLSSGSLDRIVRELKKVPR